MCILQGAAELDPQDVNKNTKKALALGNALLVCMAVPWAICVIVYSGAACLMPLLRLHDSSWPRDEFRYT